MAGLLGFHRFQQPAASGLSDHRAVLLQQALWLGLGKLQGRGQHRQGPEGKGLDEAIFILYGRKCLENCFIVDNQFNDISVKGLVGEPSYLKPNSTYQTKFVREQRVGQ